MECSRASLLLASLSLLLIQCSHSVPGNQAAYTPPAQSWPQAPRYPSPTSAPAPPAAPAYPAAPQPHWQQTAAQSQALAAGGGFLHHLQAMQAGSGLRAELQFVIFDSRQSVIQVVDQPVAHAGGSALLDRMRQAGAVAGVNGGFFHPDFSPLGLMISGARRSGSFTSTSLVSGSVLVVNHEPYLVWNSEFLGESGVSHLLQAGPRLVDAGRAVAALNTSRRAARTFVASDGKHTWLVGTASSLSLAELGSLLSTPGLLAGTNIQRALNLDGGRSSAFYARLPGGQEINRPGWSTVRNYLAVVPR